MKLSKKTPSLPKNKQGIALLLIVVISTAILSISIGIFNILFGQLIVLGQFSDSFDAMYAADLGIERTLYLDKQLNVCGGTTDCGTGDTFTSHPFTSDACYKVTVATTTGCAVPGTTRCIEATGEFSCAPGTIRSVRRTFYVSY